MSHKYVIKKYIEDNKLINKFNTIVNNINIDLKEINNFSDNIQNSIKKNKQISLISKSINELSKKHNNIEDFHKSLNKIISLSTKERTLTIIKPDAVSSSLIGEVIKRFEKEKIKPVGMKMIKINKLQANLFYGHLRMKIPKKVFKSIVNYMTSNKVVVIVWQGRGVIKKVRNLCGPTDPKRAKKSQIRSLSDEDMKKRFKQGKAVKNIIHSSSSKEDALKEIYFFFRPWEIIG